MKTIIAFLLFISFAMMETQSIWQDVLECDVVCCADMEEEEEIEKKKLEEDKLFNQFNASILFHSKSFKKNRTSVQTFIPTQIRSINTPPPEFT